MNKKTFKNPKVLNFPLNDYEVELKNLIEDIRAGKVKDLLLGYTTYEPECKESPNRFNTYWFGDHTCLYLLGLTVRLQRRISDFMDKHLDI